MDGRQVQYSPEAQYEGEDTRPTSRKELAGWYSYGWAAETFAICAMGTRKLVAFPVALMTADNTFSFLSTHHIGTIGTGERSSP